MVFGSSSISKALKPDLKKFLVLIPLLLIVSFILPALGIYTPLWHCGWGWAISCNFVSSGVGFPFVFYSSNKEVVFFGVEYLIYDLLFWYIVSCLIILVYEKFSTRSK